MPFGLVCIFFLLCVYFFFKTEPHLCCFHVFRRTQIPCPPAIGFSHGRLRKRRGCCCLRSDVFASVSNHQQEWVDDCNRTPRVQHEGRFVQPHHRPKRDDHIGNVEHRAEFATDRYVLPLCQPHIFRTKHTLSYPKVCVCSRTQRWRWPMSIQSVLLAHRQRSNRPKRAFHSVFIPRTIVFFLVIL